MGTGIILLALHNVLPHYASDIIGPLILDACAALTWVAARVFNRGSVNPYAVLAAAAAWIAISVFTGAHAGEQLSAALGIAISGCLYTAGAFDFWQARGEQLRGRWPMVSVLSLFAVSLFLAAIELSSSKHYLPTPPVGWFGIIHFVGLIYSVGAAISLIRMLKERSETEYKIAALIDPLTGLANRRAFMDRAQRIFDRSGHDEKPISLLMFDLDGFKGINDRFGHSTGDHVLRIFADDLSRVLRPADIAARMGGEEFVVVLPGCSIQAALAIADRVRRVFEGDARFLNGQRVGATVSVGVATAIEPASSLADILARADGALYQAKATGRNRIMAESDARDPQLPSVIRIA
jgi:diguanylate cyclase (GGDEF)-like protein